MKSNLLGDISSRLFKYLGSQISVYIARVAEDGSQVAVFRHMSHDPHLNLGVVGTDEYLTATATTATATVIVSAIISGIRGRRREEESPWIEHDPSRGLIVGDILEIGFAAGESTGAHNRLVP